MIFPITSEYRRRQRIKARQHEDESGGWDNCEPPPVAEILPFDLFHNQRSPKAYRLEAAAPRDSARNYRDGLPMPTHEALLSDDPLVHVQQHGDVTCATIVDRGGER